MKMVIMLMVGAVAVLQCLGGTIPGVKYDIRREENRALWYYEVDNVFDSITMRYCLGEVELVTGQYRTPIFIRLPYRDLEEGYLGHLYQGGKGQGADAVLADMICTRPFTVPQQGASISAHRMLDFTTCMVWADPPEGTAKEQYVCSTWDEMRFLAGRGWCRDTSEFVMSVVREADGAVLAVLDSIGVRPNADSWIVPAYGTDPRSTSISVVLPPSCDGERVYLRITPKRYGPTQSGMTMRRVHSTCSRSVLYAEQPPSVEPGQLPRFLDPKFSALLLQDRFESYMQYMDRYVDSTGCEPVIIGNVGWPKEHQEQIRRLRAARHLDGNQLRCRAVTDVDWQWYLRTLDDVPPTELSSGEKP